MDFKVSNYINPDLEQYQQEVNDEVARTILEHHVLAENKSPYTENGNSMPQISVFEGNAMLDAFCLYEQLEFDFLPIEPLTTRVMVDNQDDENNINMLSKDSSIQ